MNEPLPAEDPIVRLERCFVERIGISISKGGHRPLVERIIAARMQAVGAPSLEAYLRLLVAPDQREFQRLVDNTTVGLTWFFRDAEQLDAFAALARGELSGRTLRVWVAGCSTGEEVYSLAMVAHALGIDAHILGTDVNEAALVRARSGHYSAWSARSLPEAYRHWLLRSGSGDGSVEVAWELRRRASFLRHSLVELPPASGDGRHWDVIFCRNVLIYFHPTSMALAFENLARALGDDGWLFLGASEMVMPAPTLRLVPVGGRHALRRALPPSPSPLPPPALVTPPPSPTRVRRAMPIRATPATAPTTTATTIATPPTTIATAPTTIATTPTTIAPTTIAPTAIAPTATLPSSALAPSDATTKATAVKAAQLFSRAYARYAADALTEAMQLFAEVLALDPLFAEARLLLGIAYYRNGDYDDAIVALRAALFLLPELWPASFYLALSHEALGDRYGAEQHFRRVVAAADRALPPSVADELRREIEAWRPDVVAIARRHLRKMARTD
jgi:chemotaxis protein methyltransferase CheR